MLKKCVWTIVFLILMCQGVGWKGILFCSWMHLLTDIVGHTKILFTDVWCDYFLYYNSGWAPMQIYRYKRRSGWTCSTIRQVIPVSNHWFLKISRLSVWRQECSCDHKVGTLLHLWFVDVETSHFQRAKQEFLQLANGAAAPYGNKQLTQQFSEWIIRVNRKLNHVR